MRKPRQVNAALIAVLIHIAASIFLFRFSLWTDEASSVFFARMSVWDLFTHLCDPHPPGYYALLHFWMRVSDSEAWLRLLSLLASLGTLGVLYRWIRQWQGDHMARWGVIVLALQPMQVWYSAEVRMYATVQFLTILSAYLAWQLWEARGSTTRLAILYWLVASAALWTDYTSVFGLGMIQLFWIAYGWKLGWRWIGLQLALGLPTALLWLTSGQLAALGSSYQPIFLAAQAAQVGLAIAPATAAQILQAGLLIAGATGLGLALGWRQIMQRLSVTQIALLLFFGWLLLLVFGATPRLFTVKRLLLSLIPWAALLAAWALAALTSRIELRALLLVIPLLFMLGSHQKSSWRTVLQDVLQNDAADIWVDELAIPAFAYYADAEIPWRPLDYAPDSDLLISQLPRQAIIVSDDNPYRDITALLPQAFYAQYSLESDNSEHFGVRLLRFNRRNAPDLTVAAPDNTLVAEFPSPLAQCR